MECTDAAMRNKNFGFTIENHTDQYAGSDDRAQYLSSKKYVFPRLRHWPIRC